MFRRPFLVAALAALSVASYAQIDPDRLRDPDQQATERGGHRLTKAEERRKFHPTPVNGSSALLRTKAYEQRQAMKAVSPFAGLKWRNVGPEIQGGRVVDIKAPLNDPKTVYVAYATGGLWRTTDEGQHWTSVFDDQSAFGIGAIAVSRDGKTIWVGSGEANSQRTSYAGTGVFKSTDGGATWQNVGLPESQHIGQILIDPRNPNVVYVAAMGHLYSQNPERGVYKTVDGGRIWSQALKVDEYTGAIDLVMDPKNPDVLLASMWDRDRRAWNFRESGAGSGTFRTANGGKTWAKVTTLPVGDAAGRTGLAMCDSKPNVVYAFVDNQADDVDWPGEDERVPSGRLTTRRFLLLTDELLWQIDPKVLDTFLRQQTNGQLKESDIDADLKAKKLTVKELREKIEEKNSSAFDPGEAGAQVYRSDDGGKTFRRTPGGALGEFGGYYWGKVWVNPKNPDDVYVMGLPLLRSTDGGTNWTYVSQEAHVDFHAVWNDPRDPNTVWVGNDGGLYISHDGGTTVTPIHNVPVGQATTIAVDNKRPYNIYIGLQDNGTMKGPSSYVPGQTDPDAWKSIYGGDGSAVAVDPRNDGDVVYVAYQFGEHSAINQATGERWRTRPNPPKGDAPARFNWISPILVSTHHADIVYVGAQRLYRSFNQGRSFAPISPDLTRNKPNGDVPYSTLKDISESPLHFGLIYTGADDGRVMMTPDGGDQWVDISTPAKDKWVSRVVASKWDENTVYVSQNGYREDDWTPYLWKSTDRGRTWRSIAGNLPAEPINVIREDPTRKDILYVGTDMGVYVSFDGGTTWETLHGGLPNLPVHDIAIQARDNEMVIATHARSVYALPLKYVHEITPELRKTDLKLFEVDDATRSSLWGYERRERWDSSEARKPLVRVNFYTAQAGKATIRIKDKDGKVVKEKSFDAVRGYNFTDIDLQLTTGKPTTGVAIKRDVKTPQDVLADPLQGFRATYVAAGEYTLELQVGDKVATQKWKLRD